MATTAVDTVNSFVTLDEARRHLDLDPEETEKTEVLSVIINYTAKLFNQFTGRNLKERAYTALYLDGNGLTQMFLEEWPIDRTQTFTVNADSSREFTSSTLLVVWDEVAGIGTDAVMLDDEAGEIELVNGDAWPKGNKTVKVAMTAGLKIADAGHLVEVQLLQISDWWERIGRDPQLSNHTEFGVTAAFISGTLASAISPLVRQVLTSERRSTLFA